MSKKILSVDDSKMVHMVIKKTLSPYDVEVLTASNGEEGVQVATANTPDLVILDATMPIMDGIEALEKLKTQPSTRDIPVIMLSADSSQENIERAKELGALMFITKPFTSDKLIESLSPHIELTAKA